MWIRTTRVDPVCRALADKHYSRITVGAIGFVPPGRCTVLRHETGKAVWVTSWPFAAYVKHAWAGAWVNSLFRNEGAGLSSDLIRAAVAFTRTVWEPPPLGIITFVDTRKIANKVNPGFCYKKAGFEHVGYSKGGLMTFQMLPEQMPPACDGARRYELWD